MAPAVIIRAASGPQFPVKIVSAPLAVNFAMYGVKSNTLPKGTINSSPTISICGALSGRSLLAAA